MEFWTRDLGIFKHPNFKFNLQWGMYHYVNCNKITILILPPLLFTLPPPPLLLLSSPPMLQQSMVPPRPPPCSAAISTIITIATPATVGGTTSTSTSTTTTFTPRCYTTNTILPQPTYHCHPILIIVWPLNTLIS